VLQPELPCTPRGHLESSLPCVFPTHACREEQDLRCGAVRTAVVTAGSGKSPSAGSLVYLHYTVRQESSRQVVASTLTEHGGSGCPHVAVLEKGLRMPRGWELVLKGKIS
jgi:hypothetical protein